MVQFPSHTGQATFSEKQLHEVARLYLSGKTQWEIAVQFKVNQATVSRHLAVIRERWKTQAKEVYEEKLLLELAKIDNLERIAMEAWVRSTEDAETTKRVEEQAMRILEDDPPDPTASNGISPRTRKGLRKLGTPTLVPVKVVTETSRKGQTGDERFLQRIAWCIEIRLRLMGALKSDKAGTVNVININWEDLHGRATDEEDPVEQRIKQIEVKAQEPPTSTNGEANGRHDSEGL
jgi:hypothetical protein